MRLYETVTIVQLTEPPISRVNRNNFFRTKNECNDLERKTDYD